MLELRDAAAATAGPPPLRPRWSAVDCAWAAGVAVALTAAVVGVTGGWRDGALVLDGQGALLWARLSLEYARAGGQPYWVPDMWAGSPVWALAPSFPVLRLLPLSAWLGPEAAIRVASLLALVVGGVGAYVLAWTWWRQRASAIVAAGLYGLHPLLLSHLGLFGFEPGGWVMAATPWFVLTVHGALRRGGARRVAVAAAVAAFAVLMQAELAYYLAAFGVALTVAEAGRERSWLVLARAVGIAVLAFGLCAFWLLPLAALGDAFALTDPDTVAFELTRGYAADFGAQPHNFVTRLAIDARREIPPLIAPEGGAFYLGAVPLLLAALALPRLREDDRDGAVTAVVVAGLAALWTSTAGVPLAASAPALTGDVVAFAVLGLAGGFVAAAIVGRVRAPVRWLAAATLALWTLAALPFVAPFLSLRRLVPLLETLRFPRLYPAAVLAVVLLGALGLAVAERRLRTAEPRRAPIAAAAAVVLLLGVHLVDIAPYRDLFALPAQSADDAAMAAVRGYLADLPGVTRVATPQFGQPQLVGTILAAGHDLAVGWPHPLAERGVWRLTGATEFGPVPYAQRAFGVVGASHVVTRGGERPAGAVELGEDVAVSGNRHARPLVRVYGQAVVVPERSVGPELAVQLGGSGIGVVEGGEDEAAVLGPVATARVPEEVACTAAAAEMLHGPLARACAMAAWVGLPPSPSPAAEQGRGVGATFTAAASNLSAVAVELDRDPGPARLLLQRLDADGRATGAELAGSTTSGRDDNGLFRFPLRAVGGPAGARYRFALVCPACPPLTGPRLMTVPATDGTGDLEVDGRLMSDRRARFYPVHDGEPSPGPPPGSVQGEEVAPGRWRVRAELAAPALLVVAASAFPGWSATVDGSPVRVLRADGGLVGVALPAGGSAVRLSYEIPAAALVGRFVTVGTALAVAVAVLVPGTLARALLTTAGVGATRRRTRPGPRRRSPAPPTAASPAAGGRPG